MALLGAAEVVELAQVVDADGDVRHGVGTFERANVGTFARQMISANVRSVERK